MESYDGAEAIGRAWRDGLKPDPLLTVSEWADSYRVLSQRASSEPGRWRTERTPYLKEIMDCLSPSSVERHDEQPASTRPPVRPPARQVIHSGYMAR
jgi:phage terminase large subunit GpA-like protein